MVQEVKELIQMEITRKYSKKESTMDQRIVDENDIFVGEWGTKSIRID